MFNPGEGKGTSIYTVSGSRNETGGGWIWSTPLEVAKPLGSSYWNPVLNLLPNGKITLFYKSGTTPTSWIGELLFVDENGNSLTEPQSLIDNEIGPVKNKCINWNIDLVICPSSTESSGGKGYAHIDSFVPSTNASAVASSYVTGQPLVATGVRLIQPTLFVVKNGTIRALMRSSNGFVWYSDSTDIGYSWSAPQNSSIPNPDSDIDAIGTSTSGIYLAYNPERSGRTILSIGQSDDGLNFEQQIVLENNPSGTFSYPSIIQTSDGHLHVVYSWNDGRQRVNPWNGATIKHVELDVSC